MESTILRALMSDDPGNDPGDGPVIVDLLLQPIEEGYEVTWQANVVKVNNSALDGLQTVACSVRTDGDHPRLLTTSVNIFKNAAEANGRVYLHGHTDEAVVAVLAAFATVHEGTDNVACTTVAHVEM